MVLAALLMLLGASVSGRADEQLVSMKDGRQLRGDTSEEKGGKLLRIDAFDKVTTVTAAFVDKRAAAPADADLPGYEVIGKPIVPLDPKRKMKGRVEPGHEWNGMQIKEHGRQLVLPIADKKLGNITVTYELVTLTASAAHYQGVEYEEYCYRSLREMTDGDIYWLLEQMIKVNGGGKAERGWLEAAHFCRKANRQSLAKRCIAQAGNTTEAEGERKRIESMDDAAKLRLARWSVDRRMPEAGLAVAKEISTQDAFVAADKAWLESYIGETEKNMKLRDAWRKSASDLAAKIGGGAAPAPKAPSGQLHGIPLVEPELDFPEVDGDNEASGWGERISWIAQNLCIEQAKMLEDDWKAAIGSVSDDLGKARLFWLAAWYGGAIKPAMLKDAEGAWIDVAKVIEAAAHIATWAAATKDGKKDARKNAEKAGSRLPVAIQRALVAHSHMRHAPADKRPYDGAYGRGGLRKLTAETGDKKVPGISYLLQLPADYSPCLEYPLVVLWHGMNSNAADAMKWFDGQAFGRGFIIASAEFVIDKNEYRGDTQQHYGLTAVIEDVERCYRVDPDRVFMFGASMGGHGAWGCGMMHFDRLAGLATMIGGPFGLAEQIAEVGVAQVPVYSICGEVEPYVPERLRKLGAWAHAGGYDMTVVEYKGRGHVAFPEEYDLLLDWMLAKRRDPVLRRIDAAVPREGSEAFKGFLLADAVKGKTADDNTRAWPLKYLSRMTGSWRGNTLTIDANDIGKIDVWFDPAVCNFDEDVIVKINGKDTKVKLRADFGTALEACEMIGERGRFFLATKSMRVPR